MKEPNFEEYYDLKMSGEMTMDEIAKALDMPYMTLSQRFEKVYRIRLTNSKINRIPYAPIEPKIVKTEEENAKKHFNVGDWQTMTDEQKQPYLKTELTFLKQAI